MRWIKENRVTLIIAAVGLFGLGLILYPSAADWWNSFHQSRAVAAYAQKVANLDSSDYERILADAEAYNNNLAANGIDWAMSEEEIEQLECNPGSYAKLKNEVIYLRKEVEFLKKISQQVISGKRGK